MSFLSLACRKHNATYARVAFVKFGANGGLRIVEEFETKLEQRSQN